MTDPLAARVPQRSGCSYCGYLDWTVEKYGRITHKEGCPMRTDPWHQGDPDAVDPQVRLRHALKDILDAAERAMAGFPIESEEWYARRDFARVVLKDTTEAEPNG